jgi:hypothetical protein
VGARLVGHDVGRETELEEPRHHDRGVAEHPDRQRTTLVTGALAAGDRIVERVGQLVEVARLEPPLDAMRVDVRSW